MLSLWPYHESKENCFLKVAFRGSTFKATTFKGQEGGHANEGQGNPTQWWAGSEGYVPGTGQRVKAAEVGLPF